METTNNEWTVTDLTPAQPEAKPETTTARQNLTKVLTEWAHHNGLPFDEAVVSTDDDEDLVITLPGLTLEYDDIVPNEKDWEYEVVLTMEVRVTGTVVARSEDEAREAAAEDAAASVSVESYSGTVVHDEVLDYTVYEVEEV